MAIKTLCPIRDIKGWHSYNKCPYTKSLFLKAGVSDVLHTSGRKERFFNALQKNVGSGGHLTKEVMKKALGEFQHELDSNQFYKLCAAVLPDEKQRFSVGGSSVSGNRSGPSSILGGGVGSKEGAMSSKSVQPNVARFTPAGLKGSAPDNSKNNSSPEAKAEISTKQPLGLAANVLAANLNREGNFSGNKSGRSGTEKEGDFFGAIKATMKNKRS